MYALHLAGDAHVTQLYVLRGVSKDRLKVTAQKDLPCYHCQTVEEMLDMYLRCNTFYTCNRVTAIKDRMPVCTPFPQFFDPKVDSNGDVTGDARPTHAGQSRCHNHKIIIYVIIPVSSCQFGARAGRFTFEQRSGKHDRKRS